MFHCYCNRRGYRIVNSRAYYVSWRVSRVGGQRQPSAVNRSIGTSSVSRCVIRWERRRRSGTTVAHLCAVRFGDSVCLVAHGPTSHGAVGENGTDGVRPAASTTETDGATQGREETDGTGCPGQGVAVATNHIYR